MSDHSDDDDDSFSSDSDDDFLTRARDDGKNVDREALIRKKLLENFYGKSAVSSSHSGSSDEDDDSDDDGGGGAMGKKPAGISLDLDSPNFDAAAHTKKHVLQASVNDLLETEEHLACQVRTLDSSLQTLVYENYSRFIQATEAIRSIGVHVQSNEAGLQRLTTGMATIQDTSRDVEASVGALRDQVVEKLRVKRLLTRLDTLLKLPETLKNQIKARKYRLAAKSYLQAHTILSKHSAGFESLQRIEVECHELLRVMLQDLRKKLIHWSGQLDDEADDDDEPPESPKNVAEILECAGTPVLFLSKAIDDSISSVNATEDEGEQAQPEEETKSSSLPPKNSVDLDPGLTATQCQEMALKACLRYLDRVLDSHHLKLQEEKFSSPPSAGHRDDSVAQTSLVPTQVLDSILEASTLYRMSFGGDDSQNEASKTKIARFVLEAFGSFLTHVRSELFEQSVEVQQAQQERAEATKSEDDEKAAEEEEEQKEAENQANERISTSMVTLLQSVRQLASGLTLPDVGIDPGLASSMVEQTESLTETMVRRRVDSTFMLLRLRIIEDCLEPFCQNAMQEPEQDAEDSGVMPLVQLASVALSDSLQLVDDSIRSIFAEEAATDIGMLREAVEASTKRLSGWLASAIEVLAGCEYSDPRFTLDVKASKDGGAENLYEADSKDYGGASSAASTISVFDELSVYSQEAQDPIRRVDTALLNLAKKHIAPGSSEARANMTLAIAEMCRVAERSVMENISQSIATHSGEKHRKSAKNLEGLALGPDEGEAPQQQEDTTSTSRRFRLAASRALNLYAMNRGSEAAALLSSGFDELSNENITVVAPRDATWKVLELVKQTSLECASLFGGSKRGGPVPDTLEDQIGTYTISRQSARSGLIFDVERMFAEKVIAFPHPSETMDFTRNAVITIVMKVAFKAAAENVRLVRLSSSGFRQLKVDVEFLQFLVPHYVKDELALEGSNAQASVLKLLTDLIAAAGERCTDQDLVAEGGEDFTNECRAVVREFIASNDDRGGIVSKFTITED